MIVSLRRLCHALAFASRIALASVAMFIAFPLNAQSVNAQPDSEPAASAGDSVASLAPLSTGGSVLQVILALAFVLVLIFCLAWLARRAQWLSPSSAQSLRVIASVSLGPRERAVLLQAGERQLLLGVAPGRVNLIEAFEQPVVPPAAGGAAPAFSSALSSVLSSSGRSASADKTAGRNNE